MFKPFLICLPQGVIALFHLPKWMISLVCLPQWAIDSFCLPQWAIVLVCLPEWMTKFELKQVETAHWLNNVDLQNFHLESHNIVPRPQSAIVKTGTLLGLVLLLAHSKNYKSKPISNFFASGVLSHK